MEETINETIAEKLTSSKETVIAGKEFVSPARKVFNKYAFAAVIIIIAVLFTYLFLSAEQLAALQSMLHKDHYLFYWMLLAGFCAEMVAGSMGMGYGVICTTVLLVLNVPPPIISASIHSAESFTTAAGSISHWQLGNVNKRLVKALASNRRYSSYLCRRTLCENDQTCYCGLCYVSWFPYPEKCF
jgi:hypothetical protein